MRLGDMSASWLQFLNSWFASLSGMAITTSAITSSPPDPPTRKLGKFLNEAVVELYVPKSHTDIGISIIFFHGLDFGDVRDAQSRAWLSHDGADCWPQKWLPEEFPTARILSVSYNANAWITHGIDRRLIAKILVRSLIMSDAVGWGRPVVLIGHCMGGLMMKQLCLEANDQLQNFKNSPSDKRNLEDFLSNLSGLFFFSSPQRGSEIAQLFNHSRRCSRIVDHIRFADNLIKLHDDFRALRIRCNYFWEVAGVVGVLATEVGGFSGMVVSEISCQIKVGSLDITFVRENHFSVNQPNNRRSPSYAWVVQFLKRVLKWDSVDPNPATTEVVPGSGVTEPLAPDSQALAGMLPSDLQEERSATDGPAKDELRETDEGVYWPIGQEDSYRPIIETGLSATKKIAQDESNGRPTGADNVLLQEPRKALRVEVPDLELEQFDLTAVGQNPDPELQEVAGSSYEAVGPKHPWVKGSLLGSGSFGTVYEAFDSDGMFFAVKEVSLVEQDKQSKQSISQIVQEVELLSHLKHHNIVQYLGTDRADGKLYIFLEYVSRGSLASVYRSFKLSDSQISAYTRQILTGLKYLHDQNIVHRDIKCANILVDKKGICKLADFGMAKQISSLDQAKSCKGSAYWMAPEVIDPTRTYGKPADVWSLGCSIIEMATGGPPFRGMEWCRVLWTVGHGNAPPIPESLSDCAKDFVKLCLEVNASRRPSVTELLDHPFVRQVQAH